MSQPADHTVQKVLGPASISQATYDRYGVHKDETQTIYNHYLLYSRMQQWERRMNEDPEEARRRYKERFFCELCDKDVRVAVRYHHVRTKKHLRLQKAVDDKIAELKKQSEQPEQEESL